ncbi:MAG: flagellar biosynthesis protein FlhA [Pseudomonadales bacterium]|nr:flagellar biosynthesis protein FlhA [Pseudomonadales bacterium]MBP9032718.1 flagellar biosynthesis protein FlhA [Pseudomonadales bacterium]
MLRVLAQGSFGIPLLLLIVLAMMTLPIPPLLLDALFSFNIALSLVVLLVAVYALRPLDFAVFPTILLVTTLLRLALNVASTRVVLLEGHTGPDAAGHVIEAFGKVVIGGNYVVGLVVFLILIIINFVVVTKGAGRISEVSARFTLDAMPGKQMAIDADLNAGLINQDDARLRREEVAQEADFYGAMDGASKFVRGDAVAGVLILAINLVGGLAIGVAQHDLAFGDAMQIYSLLTIGDGLVAQIPALLLSTTAAIMVTRVTTSNDMGDQILGQMFDSPRALAVAAGLLGIMGLVPGMPHVAFIGLAALAGAGAWLIRRRRREVAGEQPAAAELARVASVPPAELGWDDVAAVDVIGLEVGYRLIPMVDKAQGGALLGRIKGVRKKLSQEMGFLVPPVHIRDNLELMPNAYRILLMGVAMGEAEVFPERELAINPGQVFGRVDGVECRDPAFGLDAVWIERSQHERAQTLGYTVVDASTVVATHLNQVLLEHIDELLGHEEVEQLLQKLAKMSPKLAEELVPGTLTVNQLLGVLKNLLAEGVPIRDIRSIAEAIAAQAVRSKDPAALTAAARVALGRTIFQQISGNAASLPVITLEPQMEQVLMKSLQRGGAAGGEADDIVLEPSLAERLQRSMNEAAQRQEVQGKAPVLLVPAPLRAVLARFMRHTNRATKVISYQEIPGNKQVTIEATVG